jgi:2-hydroxychromene-2-carboxylate isomerase
VSTAAIDYFHSLSSPFTYLGGPRLRAIAARHGAAIRHRPADFARIFAVTGGLPLPQRAPQRQAYRLVELARWSRHLGMPINLHPKHHFGPRELPSGVVIAAQRRGLDAGALANAILRACWAEDRDIADAATLAAVADGLGLDGAGLVREATSDPVQAEYRANTEAALAAGVFGAPSYVLEGEIFWGQDRLDFLDRALAKRGAAVGAT